MSVLPSDKPCAVLPYRNADAKSVFGEQLLNILRPLHNAERAHIEIVVKADVKGFGKLVDAVEVEMEHRLAAASPIFVDYGEGRRADGILPYAEHAAYRSRESGFAAAHRSIESNKVPAGGLLEKVPGGRIDGCEGGYGDFVFHSDDKFTRNNDMLIQVNGAKCIGIEAVAVTVEVDVTMGIGIHLCGLADVAVKESLIRTVSALSSSGFRIPGKKIVINLAPADLHKSGSGYDLPIAIGIIAASEQLSFPDLDKCLIMGELGLDGSVRQIPGALPIADMAASCGYRACILPRASALEAAEVGGLRIYGVGSLNDVIRLFSCPEDCGELLVTRAELPSEEGLPLSSSVDFEDIIGQEGAKRGVEIAAAGGHNLLMIGSPGSGKSTLAKAMADILPPMTPEEALLTRKIYSVAGKGAAACAMNYRRPFRSPHCSASLAAVIGGGGGDNVQPGEVSLAHGGVLFLDEMTLMPRSVLEALRAPLEDRKVSISRLKTKVEFPASFTLVAAANPCPCGYYGEGDRCTCTPSQRLGYLSRLSGPLIDRMDLQIYVNTVPPGRILGATKAESSAQVAQRVLAARNIQAERFKGEPINCNAEMNNKQIEKYCPLSQQCRDALERILATMRLSLRAYFRIIRVARTIADLEGSPDIAPYHLEEAASYRFLDREKAV